MKKILLSILTCFILGHHVTATILVTTKEQLAHIKTIRADLAHIKTIRADKETILVTGGNGYIGSCTAYLLLQQGYNVVVLDQHNQQPFPWPTFINGDFGDEKLLHEIFSKYIISCVMHFAAFIKVGESVEKPHEYYENNVVKTLTLLKSMVDHQVKNFIFSSSAATYGNPVRLPIDENHPTNPESPYGRTKLMIDQLLPDYAVAYGLRFVCLRYFNAAGALPEANLGSVQKYNVVPILLDALKHDKAFTIFGSDYQTPDGTCVRDYIHVHDIAQAHILALGYLQQNKPSKIFNLGSGAGYTVQEIINAAQTVVGKKLNVIIGARRPGDVQTIIADSTAAHNELGWYPQYSDLNTIISSAWEWERKV